MNPALSLSARCLAAIVGGYIVAALSSLALVPVQMSLFDNRLEDAILIATMFSYLVYIAVIIDCFCRSSASRAWRNVLVYSGIFLTVCYYGGGLI
ncbi:hypothetical protein [Thalassomonas sp. RHCl1]|uniref:hypothetical protein n=1 Tax=Thalassomonas sp. RHCl1 TaxID=2995320 RepID=UPI00248AA9C5|nr:hypothetical protein [Thalassomonas sp. RHCl1]